MEDRNKTAHLKVQKAILQLNALGLTYAQVPGDGHCLFHAVGLYLGKDQSDLRRTVAEHIEHNLAKFDQYIALSDGKTINDYVQAVRNGQEWASHVEIEVLMRVLNRPIMVISFEGNLRNREDANRFGGEPIFVYYNNRNHYDALLLTERANGREILNFLLARSHNDRNDYEDIAIDISTQQSKIRTIEGEIEKNVHLKHQVSPNDGTIPEEAPEATSQRLWPSYQNRNNRINQLFAENDPNDNSQLNQSAGSVNPLNRIDLYQHFIDQLNQLDFFSAFMRQEALIGKKIRDLTDNIDKTQLRLSKLIEEKTEVDAKIKLLKKEYEIGRSQLSKLAQLHDVTLIKGLTKMDQHSDNIGVNIIEENVNSIFTKKAELEEQSRQYRDMIRGMDSMISKKMQVLRHTESLLYITQNITPYYFKSILNDDLINVLDFRNFKISIEDMRAIIVAIAESSNYLTHINLSGHNFADDASFISSLSKLLIRTKTLLYLDLSNISLDNSHCIELAKALEDNSTLKIIKFTSNAITKEGFEILLTVIKKHHSLRAVLFDDNLIYLTNDEFLAIRSELSVSSNCIISLSGNFINTDKDEPITRQNFISHKTWTYSCIKPEEIINYNECLLFLNSLDNAPCIIEKINKYGQWVIESYGLQFQDELKPEKNISVTELLALRKTEEQIVATSIFKKIKLHNVTPLIENIRSYFNQYKQIQPLIDLMKKTPSKQPYFSKENYVIVRVWPPKHNQRRVNLPVALVNTMFNDSTNVGHVSIEIFEDNGKSLYISHWPHNNRLNKRNTLAEDIKAEGKYAPTVLVLYSLDVSAMKKYDNEHESKTPYSFYNVVWGLNCSGYVYNVLKAGGLYDIILQSDSMLIEPITPNAIKELVRRASLLERILYPITQDLYKMNADDFIEKLLDLSKRKDLKTIMRVKNLLESDEMTLYGKLYQNEEIEKIKRIKDNLIENLSEFLHEAVQKKCCQIIKELLNQGADIRTKDGGGYNVLQSAILGGDERIVREILGYAYIDNRMIEDVINDDNIFVEKEAENIFKLSYNQSLVTYSLVLNLNEQTENDKVINERIRHRLQNKIDIMSHNNEGHRSSILHHDSPIISHNRVSLNTRQATQEDRKEEVMQIDLDFCP